jgi:phage shock protein A
MEELRKKNFELVENILVFEPVLKDKIRAKIITLSEEKLRQLEEMLMDVADWQEEAIIRLINQNPELYNQILSQRVQFEKEIMSEYKEKLAAQDRDKMNIILNKIHSL